jgi:hypothetical protein
VLAWRALAQLKPEPTAHPRPAGARGPHRLWGPDLYHSALAELRVRWALMQAVSAGQFAAQPRQEQAAPAPQAQG